MINKKVILITGGAGAIGGNLVKALSKTGNKIIVIDDLSSGDRENCPNQDNVIFYKGSILDNELLTKIFLNSNHKVNIVFHLAAHFANQNSIDHPQEDLLTNALGTLKLLEFSRKAEVGKFVYASSSCIYGDKETDLKEDLFFKLETPYAISKLCGEEYMHFYHNFHNLKVVILRYFNAFGPGDPPGKYRNVIPNFMYLAIRNKPLIITGTGEETRDFTYMDDIVRGTILAAQVKEVSGQTFNIGTGREIKVRYVAELINKLSGNRVGIRFIRRRGWDKIVKRVANIEKSRKMLNYSPEISFEEGLERAFAWFKAKYSR